jgi:tetrahydromethanopterin S-methyltransferase subunit E
MYQDIYTGSDEIATRLQEQTIMSYMILHSPFIMGLIATIGGVLMFGMKSSEGDNYGGAI